MAFNQKLTPRSHQSEALSAIANEMAVADRALVVMACGTGKTLVELWAAEALRPARILVLVPTLNLLQQTFHEWRDQHGWGSGFRSICVCSDSGIGGQRPDGESDELAFNAGDLDFPTSTDPATVNRFLDAAQPGGTSVLFSTYQSAAVVGEALSERRVKDAYIDVGIFDEAHKTVGDADRAFSYALADRNLRLKKRLFFTATPRVVDSRGNRDADGEISILSMDDEAAYGKRVHELGFAEAARRGIIVPYKLIISVINDRDISSEQMQASVVNMDGVSVGAPMVANRIALARAVERFGIKKAITFHSTVEEARVFSLLADTGENSPLEDFERLHVSGSMRLKDREQQMDRFRQAPRAINSNAKCLTEGVDVPAVDLVAFMSPKESQVDIVQAAGRSMRLAGPDKTTGYILLPIHVNPELGESVDDAVKRSDYKTILDVLRALMANDSEFEDVVRSQSLKSGEKRERRSRFVGKVEIVCNALDDQGLSDSIEAMLFDEINGWHATFDERFERLVAFKTRYGHCEVPKRFEGLGVWCIAQRYALRKPGYPEDRRRRLEALGFRLDSREILNADESFESNFEKLLVFKIQHGHCEVPGNYSPLGKWADNQRRKSKSHLYPDDRRKRLTDIGFRFAVSNNSELFESKYLELAAYKTANGHCDVPTSFGPLGVWCSSQRNKAKGFSYSLERRQRLKALGFRFSTNSSNCPILEISEQDQP